MPGVVANSLIQHLNLRRVQVTQFKTENHFARYDVVSSGPRLKLADCAHLPAGNASHNSIHRFNELRRGKHRIAALVHRRRAGVISEAFDLHLPLGDADDAFDDPDVDLLGVQNAALFDVQLKVRGDVTALATDACELVRVAADKLDAVANRLAAVGHQVQLSIGQL